VRPSFWREIRVLAGIAFTSLVLGAITGRYFIVAAVGFGLYIAATLRHLHRLHQWLQNRSEREIPDAAGLWGDVFNEIRKLMKHTGQREDQLTDMVSRFQSAASAMPDAMVIVSENDEIEWANPSAENLLGIHFPRDTGMRLGNLMRDPEFVEYLQRHEFSEPLELPSPANPELTAALQIIPFGSRQKLLLGHDITRLVRLEQMRRIFVANVSHEMRTPLTVLTGFLETLRDMKFVRPEDLSKHLETMHEQAARLQRLVDDLLTLSRLETAPPRRHDEAVDAPALLAALKEQAELLSGAAHHRLTLDAQPGLRLLGSREELHSAFSNLINNAVRYTPAGGAIELRWWADDDGAKFAVRDSGDGIAPEHIPHLTERFYRVDTARSRASGGTGLGLSIVKHVLLRHDARLDIQSEVGKGSTFTCVFPAKRIVPAPALIHSQAG
jgi:two-component system phosphate regulon sensor histidine kinase PhoR